MNIKDYMTEEKVHELTNISTSIAREIKAIHPNIKYTKEDQWGIWRASIWNRLNSTFDMETGKGIFEGGFVWDYLKTMFSDKETNA